MEQIIAEREYLGAEKPREDVAVAAMLYAYVNSCKRSEGRTKWSCNDQKSHEKLRTALLLYMDASTLDMSVMQIRGVHSL